MTDEGVLSVQQCGFVQASVSFWLRTAFLGRLVLHLSSDHKHWFML